MITLSELYRHLMSRLKEGTATRERYRKLVESQMTANELEVRLKLIQR
jgi:hypothetical protein